MGRLKAVHFAPLLAIIALFAWALASPMGAAPDDDYHLVSTWCAVDDGTTCAPGTSDTSRLAPEAIVNAPCFAQAPDESAACQSNFDFSGTPNELTTRGNFVGAYPPVYYSVMHLFVGGDILASVMVMRLVNVLLFVGLTTALFWLLPVARRQTLVWAWTISTLPMGMFLIASNNPSGWAIVGVGTSWIALLGYLESVGHRRWLLGAIAAIATIMAAGSRGDAAIYTVLGIGAVFVLTVPRLKLEWRGYLLKAILPIALVTVCLAFFLSANQTQAGLSGFDGEAGSGGGEVDRGTTAESLTGFGRFAYNLLNVPFLWAGNFGEWGLGWLDTSLPSVVSFGAISCFVAIGFIGLNRLWGRKLFVVLGAGLTLWLLPVYVLTKGGQIVGEEVQPRYVLPLTVLLAGLVLVTRAGEKLSLTRAQTYLVIGTLSVANLVSLQLNMRRYITGIDKSGLNLDAGIEWWWGGMPSPMVVWVVGSLAYAALLFVATREVSGRAAHRAPAVISPTPAEDQAVPIAR